jgi:hypothetical protein
MSEVQKAPWLALEALRVSLQKLRFGVTGMREIHSRCARNRQFLRDMLVRRNVPVETPAASLDLIVHPARRPMQTLQQKWGPVPLDNRDFLISMQPSVTAGRVKALVRLLCRGLPRTVDASAILAVNRAIIVYPALSCKAPSARSRMACCIKILK